MWRRRIASSFKTPAQRRGWAEGYRETGAAGEAAERAAGAGRTGLVVPAAGWTAAPGGSCWAATAPARAAPRRGGGLVSASSSAAVSASGAVDVGRTVFHLERDQHGASPRRGAGLRPGVAVLRQALLEPGRVRQLGCRTPGGTAATRLRVRPHDQAGVGEAGSTGTSDPDPACAAARCRCGRARFPARCGGGDDVLRQLQSGVDLRLREGRVDAAVGVSFQPGLTISMPIELLFSWCSSSSSSCRRGRRRVSSTRL
jgi:hypothetical protein